MKNTVLTQLDHNQIIKHIFDEENDAQRVSIVSGQIPDIKVDIDPSTITAAIQKGLESFNPQPQKTDNFNIQVVEVPVIIKETIIEKIEVPVIIKEIEYREIKVPFEVIKTIEIEKPIIIKQPEVHILTKSTLETKYLRVAVGCLLISEILTLLFIFSRH